jgi:hypothetical protein
MARSEIVPLRCLTNSAEQRPRRPRRRWCASAVRVSAMSTIVRTGTEATSPAARAIAIIVIAI